jgi:hypothetical protein
MKMDDFDVDLEIIKSQMDDYITDVQYPTLNDISSLI